MSIFRDLSELAECFARLRLKSKSLKRDVLSVDGWEQQVSKVRCSVNEDIKVLELKISEAETVYESLRDRIWEISRSHSK